MTTLHITLTVSGSQALHDKFVDKVESCAHLSLDMIRSLSIAIGLNLGLTEADDFKISGFRAYVEKED